MSRLQRVTGRQALKALQRAGFVLVRTKGFHHFIRHSDGRATVIPIHAGETLGPGLFNRILKDVEIERDEFAKLL
ncbi:MAG TPA: type II toxin-antitoxin system HicA family toxin [Chthoniobacter sp.]|jgi:predicted RNA binding protein YcfA (HicA-like mRNA interferase family)